jgi:hypothetical protein
VWSTFGLSLRSTAVATTDTVLAGEFPHSSFAAEDSSCVFFIEDFPYRFLKKKNFNLFLLNY